MGKVCRHDIWTYLATRSRSAFGRRNLKLLTSGWSSIWGIDLEGSPGPLSQLPTSLYWSVGPVNEEHRFNRYVQSRPRYLESTRIKGSEYRSNRKWNVWTSICRIHITWAVRRQTDPIARSPWWNSRCSITKFSIFFRHLTFSDFSTNDLCMLLTGATKLDQAFCCKYNVSSTLVSRYLMKSWSDYCESKEGKSSRLMYAKIAALK